MKLFNIRVILFVVCALSGCRSMRGVSSPHGAELSTIERFNPPPAEEWKLSNGLTVLLLRDSELPLVNATLYIPGGTLLESAAHNGSIGAMGELLRQGGAGKRSADQLDRDLERLAAGVGSSFAEEFGSISFECLSSDLDTVFPIFSDVVLRPRFEQHRLQLWKGRALESIRRRKDDPDSIAQIASLQLLYGTTVYGDIIESSDVRKLDRAVLQDLHAEIVKPDQAILAVSGDISREQLESLVTAAFASWVPRGSVVSAPPPIAFTPTPGVYFIKSPLEQATILIQHRGVPRLTADAIAIEGFNEIFGASGFGSRLMDKIRTESGLVYGIYGSIIPGAVEGRNIISLQTKAESAGEAIRQSLEVLTKMQQEPPTHAEMVEMQEGVSHSFIFRFDSPAELVRRYALLKLLKYPQDYDTTYLSKIAALKAADIQDVANRRWDPRKFVLVVVGNETAYNSIVALLKDAPHELEGAAIHQLQFDEQLKLP